MTPSDSTTTAQTHQETLRLLLNSDTSPCLYAHEVAALLAAIEALAALGRISNERELSGDTWVMTANASIAAKALQHGK